MKRTAILLLCAVLLLTGVAPLLTGCHRGTRLASVLPPDVFDEGREYEITFWAKNDTNKTQVAVYERAIDAFQALYPNIRVKLVTYTDYAKIYNDIITNIATKTTPNLCISYPDHIATYLTGENVVVALDSWMDHPKYGLGGSEVRFDAPKKDEMIRKFLDEGKIGGVQYALPYMRSTEACYVNKTLLESLGYTLPDVLTWDFVFEVSEAAMQKNADGTFVANGQKTLIPCIYKSTDNMMIQMLRQKGAGYSGENGEVFIFNETTKELLYTIAEHAETRAFSTFAISSYPANFLNKGQCIFAIDSTAGATWMGTNAPLSDIAAESITPFETAVRPVPQFEPSAPQMISQGPSLCLFNKEDPAEVLASWLFMQFLLTDEVQIAYAQTEGYIPVTAKAHANDDYRDYLSRAGEDNALYYDVKIRATQLLLDNIENTFVTPVFNGSASLRSLAGQLIEEVTKTMRRKEEMNDAYLDALYQKLTALYHVGGRSTGGRRVLGPLPATSVALLVTIGAAWLGMGAYLLLTRKPRKRGKSK